MTTTSHHQDDPVDALALAVAGSLHVHFDPSISVISIPSRRMLSSDDKAKIWFSPRELRLQQMHDTYGDDENDNLFETSATAEMHHQCPPTSPQQPRLRPRLRRSNAFSLESEEDPDENEKPTGKPRRMLRRSRAFGYYD